MYIYMFRRFEYDIPYFLDKLDSIFFTTLRTTS
jgi:hypothetical protein